LFIAERLFDFGAKDPRLHVLHRVRCDKLLRSDAVEPGSEGLKESKGECFRTATTRSEMDSPVSAGLLVPLSSVDEEVMDFGCSTALIATMAQKPE
jgi:hypothetical protein